MNYLDSLDVHPTEVVITDTNSHRYTDPHTDESGTRKKGLIPRDWTAHPQGIYKGETGMHAVPDLPSFDASDFPRMIDDQLKESRRLSDFRAIRGPSNGLIPSRDQNGRGYCWRHSGTSAHLLLRAVQNEPYVDLSAYAGACMIKRYRDEGGWGAQGLDDIMERGDPSSQFWPQQSTSRSNDNPATWENAKLHRITEGFIDLGSPQYDRNLTVNQMITCLLCCIPVVVDFNWWSHSVCAMDAVNGKSQWKVTRNIVSGKLMKLAEFESFWGMHTVMAGIAIRIWNSWSDSWSEKGSGLLTGSKAVPDGATAPRLATTSLAA